MKKLIYVRIYNAVHPCAIETSIITRRQTVQPWHRMMKVSSWADFASKPQAVTNIAIQNTKGINQSCTRALIRIEIVIISHRLQE